MGQPGQVYHDCSYSEQERSNGKKQELLNNKLHPIVNLV